MSARPRWGPTDICMIRMALRKYYDRVMLYGGSYSRGWFDLSVISVDKT